MNRKPFYWINILLPLLAGALLYLFWRPDAYISRLFSGLFHMPPGPEHGRPAGVYRFIRYYLCDILWAYAFTFSLSLYFGKDALLTALAVSVGFAVLTELLQLLPQTPGSFDILDIIVEMAVCTLTIIFINLYERRNTL